MLIRNLGQVVRFMLCTAVLAVLGAAVFGQGRCGEDACAYVQCNDAYWGFVAVPQVNWTADIRQGPCLQSCADGPCFHIHTFSIADPHGAGVLMVEDVTPEVIKSLRSFRSHFDAKETNTMSLLDWQKAIAAKLKNKSRIVSGEEFNERIKQALKSDCSRGK